MTWVLAAICLGGIVWLSRAPEGSRSEFWAGVTVLSSFGVIAVGYGVGLFS